MDVRARGTVQSNQFRVLFFLSDVDWNVAIVRVYILSADNLFGEGLTNLLRHESEIEIVDQGADVNKACEEIKRLDADAVIVVSNDLLQDSESIVTRLLKMETPVNVIALNLNENKFDLYQRGQWEGRGITDLVSAIKSKLSTSHQTM